MLTELAKSWNYDLLCTHGIDELLLLDILGNLEILEEIGAAWEGLVAGLLM